MADNIIRRIIRLVLDKDAASQAQKEIDGVGDKIENRWKSLAAKIAGYLGVAFLTKKVIEFGKTSVEEANKSQAAWSELKGTIDATGASFDALEKNLRETADAFQDATIHDDDAFAESLSRVISLTGDVTASLNNMGLIANVAARFFNGELAPATDLVAKVMNGNTAALQRMGIHVKSAQEGLEVLASRSFGAASREAQTFQGQLKQINNLWDDFQKEVGNAIIGSDGATGAIDVLRAAIETLTEWVVDNRDQIRDWVTAGIKFAIDSADVLIRAVLGMAKVIGGTLTLAYAAATKAGEGWIRIFAATRTIDAYFARGDRAKRFQEQADALNAMADSMGKVADEALKLGNQRLQSGLETLSTRLFTSDDIIDRAVSNRNKPKPKTPGEGNKPMTTKGVLTDSEQKVQDAIAAYNKAGQVIGAMTAALGKDFDKTGAEIDRTTTLLKVMAEEGIDDSLLPMFIQLQEKLGLLKNTVDPLDQVFVDLNKTMRDDLAFAAATGATELDKLRMQQNALQKAIRDSIARGINPQSSAFKQLEKDYARVTHAIDDQTAAMELQTEVADTLAEVLGVALQGGLKEAASKKARQNAIEAAEMLVRAAAFALFGNFPAAGKSLVLAAKYGAVAAAWGALAAASRGGGSADASAGTAAGGAGGSAGSEVTTARETAARTTRDARQLGPDVSIYLVGPGFEATNPAVQRVVWGASQEAAQRFGPNARIRVRPAGE